MSNPFDLTGRVAIVTGAGKGIGRGIALCLARAGADVAVAARSIRDLEEVAAEVRALGRRAIAVATAFARFRFVWRFNSTATAIRRDSRGSLCIDRYDRTSGNADRSARKSILEA